MIVLGVISDTHIPDRVRSLHPEVLPRFRAVGVQAILHAGDISSQAVLSELEHVAPVFAVRGNRDWLWLPHLPSKRCLSFHGVQIGMMHGHGSWKQYLWDKPFFYWRGYHHARLLPRLQAAFPQARVIVFGHGHAALNQWINGQLFFNPGSPHLPDRKDLARSVGVLRISAENEVSGEIIELKDQAGSVTVV